MKFVIFHGAFGGPEENWFPELKEKLQLFGQIVITPQFPVEDWNEVTKKGPESPPLNQTLDNWIKTFEEKVIPFIKKGEKLCFVGHSLAPVFILQIVDRFNLKLDCAIFVSPFMNNLNNKKYWQFDHVNQTFYKNDFNFEKLKKLIPISYVLYSDNDPYVDKKHAISFANALNSSLIYVKKAGHMNSAVNLNEFPLVLELCKSRIDLTLYQRYLEHKRELFSINYTKGKHEEILYLNTEDIFDEGMFHFRNLSKKGFATFFTGLKIWDTQSEYYQEARKAARRVKDFVRVFIVDKLSDLERQIVKEQIKFDLQASIKCYLVKCKDILEDTKELDFGIWDDDYLCIVKMKNDRQVEVKLSSRKKDIKEANVWRENILKKATRIYNIDTDIKNFIKKNS
jgi:uncharacterized protein